MTRMNAMRTTVIIIFVLLVLYCGQACASELDDTQDIIVEVDSVSLYFDNDLYLQFTYCHKGFFSTLGYGLRADSLEMLICIDFVSPVKADVPRKESNRFEIPQEWMKHDKLPIIFSLVFTLYDQDSFESAEIVGMYTYTDTIEVTITE